MNSHKNARLTYVRRLQMVLEVIQGRASVPRAARSHGVTDKTARKWLGRYLALGEAGLADAVKRYDLVFSEKPVRTSILTATLTRLFASQTP